MNEKTNGQIRHLITAVGGILIAAGVITQDEASQFSESAMIAIGAVMNVATMVWSWRAKKEG